MFFVGSSVGQVRIHLEMRRSQQSISMRLWKLGDLNPNMFSSLKWSGLRSQSRTKEQRVSPDSS